MPALALYTSLGFVPEKRLHRFYLNGKDAFRLVLPLSGGGAEDAAAIPQKQLPSSLGTLPDADDDDEAEQGSSAGEENDYAEDTAKLVRLRRRVAALRACRMITVWPADDDEDRVSGR